MKGFTLVELMIVIAIVALVGGMVTIRFVQGNQGVAVENSVLLLAANIKSARSNTISGQVSSTASSWGVYISPTTLSHPVLFADVDQDGTFSSGDTTEDIFLDENTEFLGCRINSTTVPDCGVIFLSPNGEASLFTLTGSPTAPFSSLQIGIQAKGNTSIQSDITVTAPSGLVVTSITL